MENRTGDLPYISSRQNPFVLLLGSLNDRKGREREGLFRFDGFKLFAEAAACGVPLRYVVLREDAAEKFGERVASLAPGTDVRVLSESAFSKISEEKSPEGIITVAKYIDKLHKKDKINNIPALLAGKKVLALESVRDPGNLGTVIRSAAAFGIDALLLSADCADIYHPRTLRAAMGAVFSRQLVLTDDLPGALRGLRAGGRRAFAATLSPDAVLLGDAGLCASDTVVIGNEGHGLSPEVTAACTGSVILPMCQGPGVESLNAAAAATVFMWELSKL